MATAIILNSVGLFILLIASTVLFIMLMNAYKHISKLEKEKEEVCEYYFKALKRRTGLDENSDGCNFEERK